MPGSKYCKQATDNQDHLFLKTPPQQVFPPTDEKNRLREVNQCAQLVNNRVSTQTKVF